MKKLLLLLLFSTTIMQAQQKDQLKDENYYKENFEHKLIIIEQTQSIIVGVVKELKERKFAANKQAKALVMEGMAALDQAKKYKEEYTQYAKDKKWKKAFLAAESYWQLQIKSADVLLRARKILKKG